MQFIIAVCGAEDSLVCAIFYRRGKPRVGLMVDSDRLTGATRLYERAGMRVYNRFHAYEKEVRAGVDWVRK